MEIKNLTKTVFVAAFAGAMIFSSCNNPKQQQNAGTDKDTQVAVIEDDGVKTKDFTVYTYAEKDKALADANAELDKLNGKIDEMKADLKAKSEELSDEAKAEYEKSIAALEKERDEFKAEADKIQNSTEEDWEQLKKDISTTYNEAAANVEKGWENFKDGVEKAAQDVKDALK